MMKNLTILFLLFAGVTGGQAQDLGVVRRADNEDKELQIGAYIGTNVFTITSDPGLRDSGMGLGWQLGLFARIGGSRLYIQPGVEYLSNTSSNVERPIAQGVTARDDLNLRYLKVPVTVGYKIQNPFSRDPHLRLLAGPSFAYNIGVKDNDLGIRRRDVRNAQFALNGGFGFDLWIFNLDLMYHHNLNTVLNANNAEGKGRGVSVNAGLRF